ncbi:SCO2400 family protein [Streptomyces sp. NPDC001123]
MDYCSSCRRHLNGALACPGCGAYAPDIAPRAVAAPATTGAAAWQAPADTARSDTDAYAEEAAEDPYDGPGAAASAPLGRAARRRQRARWKKNQRRAVVATAVALVGGGLTVASLDRQGGDRAQAATAPDNRPMGLADEQATDTDPAASAPTGRHRAPDPTPSARKATANTPREQTTGVPHATPASGQDTATTATRTATSAAARAGSAATVSGTTTGTAAEPTATPTPTATATAAAGTSASSASPAPTATSPSQLCLLVICLG